MKLIISWICILSVTSAAYGEKECRTSSGKCEFSFVYSGSHSICTQSGSKDEPRPWCYQGSDSDSKWDYCPENCFECGVSNNITISCNKQRQGEEGDLENDAFPWHVFIVGRAEQEKLCNGIILTHNRLLTTANCAQYYHSKVIDVYAGSGGRFPSNGYQGASIQKYIQHENYNITTRENNIAIIFLNNTLVWNDKVLPICFSSDNFPVEEGKLATFTGSDIVQNEYLIKRIHYSIVKTLPDYVHKVCKNEGFLCTTRNSVRDDHNEGGPLTVDSQKQVDVERRIIRTFITLKFLRATFLTGPVEINGEYEIMIIPLLVRGCQDKIGNPCQRSRKCFELDYYEHCRSTCGCCDDDCRNNLTTCKKTLSFCFAREKDDCLRSCVFCFLNKSCEWCDKKCENLMIYDHQCYRYKQHGYCENYHPYCSVYQRMAGVQRLLSMYSCAPFECFNFNSTQALEKFIESKQNGTRTNIALSSVLFNMDNCFGMGYSLPLYVIKEGRKFIQQGLHISVRRRRHISLINSTIELHQAE
ncbi:unnamed protein product [Lepeophtheirus salmonis]|uniref:(salmon louse) hypothetical protein n=1 Tax=Lepeophtheirus salmonis TaxID=72036 RepID=A0A7R8CEQ1_LEPSM|nr:unnamed protein product [Lepeophtheirus salmonis]CAF2759160.1 unnamed protein product [Lepeophtheirus salmonis]